MSNIYQFEFPMPTHPVKESNIVFQSKCIFRKICITSTNITAISKFRTAIRKRCTGNVYIYPNRYFIIDFIIPNPEHKKNIDKTICPKCDCNDLYGVSNTPVRFK